MLLLTSCVYFPTSTPEELRDTDYGYKPDNYEKIVRDHASTILPEPSSAQYSYVKGPAKTWVFKHTHYEYSWGICHIIRAKNSYGNMGSKLYFALINM